MRKVFHDIGRDRPKAAVGATHEFLVEGPSLSECSDRISGFLESYELVRYGSFDIDRKESLPGTSEDFSRRLDDSIAENRRRLRTFIEELGEDGVTGLKDLMAMSEGYQSKTVHTIAHLLDGFFGIDSHFFNLADNSHWLPADRLRKITAAPADYFLVVVHASIWPPE